MPLPAATAVIRPPAPAEFAALATNEAACHVRPWNRRLLADSLADRHALVLVGVEGGLVVGHVVARRVLDEGEVLNLCVAPGRRRRGWGRALLAAALARLEPRGAARTFLEVRAANSAALALYAALGFRQLAVRRHYYPPAEAGDHREDARVMVREGAVAPPGPPGPCPDSAPTPPNPDRSP